MLSKKSPALPTLSGATAPGAALFRSASLRRRWAQVRRRRVPLLALAAVLLLYFGVFSGLPNGRPSPPPLPHYDGFAYEGAAGSDFPSPQLAQFWQELVAELVGAEPASGPIILDGEPRREDMDPSASDSEDIRVTDIVRMPDSDREALAGAHDRFRWAAVGLAARMPFKRHARGIVMTAGGMYLGVAVTSLLMLRRTGSTLPVELFLDSAHEYNAHICDEALPALNARCVLMEDVLGTAPSMPALKKYQFKVFSILFSSFQDVLFLDADAWPVRSPDHIFDSPPYRSHGLITWPDLWLPTVSPCFYAVANISYPPLVTPDGYRRRSSESGIMLWDKSRHADSLLLAAYYNFYGQYYYPLLSQGAHGQGDKETFLQAAWVMGRPAYAVRTEIGMLGRWINGSFETAGMKQADPVEDYKLFGAGAGGEEQQQQQQQAGGKAARAMFIHHNLVKMDIRHIGAALDKAYRLDDDGQLTRLWGETRRLTETAGYDVEKAMWAEIIRADCQVSWLEGCERLKDFYRAVFETYRDA